MIRTDDDNLFGSLLRVDDLNFILERVDFNVFSMRSIGSE